MPKFGQRYNFFCTYAREWVKIFFKNNFVVGCRTRLVAWCGENIGW